MENYELGNSTVIQFDNYLNLNENPEVMKHGEWFFNNLQTDQVPCARVLELRIIDNKPYILKSRRHFYTSNKMVLKDETPGGKLEDGEFPTITALREEHEEVYFDFHRHSIVMPLYYSNSFSKYVNTYILKWTEGMTSARYLSKIKKEGEDWRWAELDFMIARARGRDFKMFPSLSETLSNDEVLNSINTFVQRIPHK